jgi:hypothetical protein
MESSSNFLANVKREHPLPQQPEISTSESSGLLDAACSPSSFYEIRSSSGELIDGAKMYVNMVPSRLITKYVMLTLKALSEKGYLNESLNFAASSNPETVSFCPTNIKPSEPPLVADSTPASIFKIEIPSSTKKALNESKCASGQKNECNPSLSENSTSLENGRDASTSTVSDMMFGDENLMENAKVHTPLPATASDETEVKP